jgi:hypothetical protein
MRFLFMRSARYASGIHLINQRDLGYHYSFTNLQIIDIEGDILQYWVYGTYNEQTTIKYGIFLTQLLQPMCRAVAT